MWLSAVSRVTIQTGYCVSWAEKLTISFNVGYPLMSFRVAHTVCTQARLMLRVQFVH